MKNVYFVVLIASALLLPMIMPTVPAAAGDPKVWDTGSINDLAMSGNGKFLVAGCADKQVYAINWNSDSVESYDTATGPLRTDGGAINAVDVSDEVETGEYYAAAACQDNSVYFLKRTSAAWIGSIDLSRPVSTVAISDNGMYAVAGTAVETWRTENAKIHLMTRSGDVVTETKGTSNPWPFTVKGKSSVEPTRNIKAIELSGDGKYMVAAAGGYAYQFERSVGEQWNRSFTSDVTDVAISNDGGYYAVSTGNFIHGFVRATRQGWAYNAGASVSKIAISGDGKLIAATAGSKLVVLAFNASAAQPLSLKWSFSAPNALSSLAISKDGNYVSVSSGNNAYYFHTSSNTPIRNYAGGMSAVCVDDKGAYHATGGSSKVYLMEPVYGIEISSQSHTASLLPGANRTFQLTVTNKGNRYDPVSLSHAGTYIAWGAFDTSPLTISPENSALFNYTVAVPDKNSLGDYGAAKAGTIALIPVKATSGLSSAVHGSLDLEVSVLQRYSASVQPARVAASADAGSGATLSFTILNSGNGGDKIKLSVSETTSTGWPYTLGASTLELGSNRYQEVTLTVTPPANALDGSQAEFRISAKPQNGAGAAAIAEGAVAVNPVYGVKLEGESAISVKEASAVQHSFSVKNTGNLDSTYLLSVSTSASGWEYHLSEESLEVSAGAARTVTLTVVPPEGAKAGAKATFTISVVAEDSSATSSTLAVSAVVEKVGGIPGFEVAFAILGGLFVAIATRRKR
ncbi:MAG: hypothetical protein CVT48_00960 [Thermoplasmata archaeon HGW-Thermoplasmata-1]|nr:MAG: hypothetical protein CVT48_00960 [Thermoplasmata archaeon HGW-Thermoplasmata-1]